MSTNSLTNLLYEQKPMKLLTSRMDLGVGHLSMASVFGSVDIPAAETILPKNST